MKTNNDLVDRLKAKEKAAQDEVVQTYAARLFVYFRNRIKGEESYEDLVHEVLASFFEVVEKEKLKDDGLIGPFMFGIAKRVMFTFFYKKKRNEKIREKGETQFRLSYVLEEDNRLENEKMAEIVRDVIEKKLPGIDRVIIKEFYLNEKDIGEVAGIIGKSRHYVSVRKERALKRLKDEILKLKDVYFH